MKDYKNHKPKQCNWKFIPHVAFIFLAMWIINYIGG
jgi:hypothetical protein